MEQFSDIIKPEHLLRLDVIEARARNLNLSLAELCARSQVPNTSLWRWRHRANDPRLSSFAAAMRRLDAALAAEETRLREVLCLETQNGGSAGGSL